MCFWPDGWAGLSFAPAGDSHLGVAVGTYVVSVGSNEFWAGIDVAFILRFGWAGLSFVPAGDSHIGVAAVGTYIGVAVGTHVM